MESSKIDAIISAWRGEGETLTFTRIKQHLVSKGIIRKTNDRSLSRWLRNLVKDSTLKKTEDGYVLEMKPKEYQVFDYLNEVRQKYSHLIYEGEVGGWISHICALTYLNFDETLLKQVDEKIAFDIISTRIAELFWALYLLRNTLVKRRCDLKHLRLPDVVVREVFFGMLNTSIGTHRATDEIVNKYLHSLNQSWKPHFHRLWKTNKPEREKLDYTLLLQEDFFLDAIPDDIESYKRHLKKTASLDINKYTVKQLIDKFIDINKWIEKNHAKEMREKHGYMLTAEESELESNCRRAILAKVAEKIKRLGTNLEDFAVILTRHPATMDQYYTPEHILYEAMDWAKGPPKDEFLKKLWYEIHEQEKTFEGMVAWRLVNMGGLNIQKYENLRHKPWVARKLAKLGDFDKILELYTKKLKERLSRERNRDFFKVLGLSGEAFTETD